MLPSRSSLAAALPSVAVAALGALPLLASAHVGVDGAAHHDAGFAQGFLHPFTGLDHLAAMVAVGLWGAFLGPPAIWLLPVTFPLVMALGGALGVVGVPIRGIEFGIAASAVVIGAAVLLAVDADLATVAEA